MTKTGAIEPMISTIEKEGGGTRIQGLPSDGAPSGIGVGKNIIKPMERTFGCPNPQVEASSMVRECSAASHMDKHLMKKRMFM